jgi:cytoskeletal protein CcmA (bactofilin family)
MMFNRKADRLKLILGESSKITGDVEALGTIIVDGTIIGHMTAEKIILGEKAYVKGNVAANSVIIGGKIDGHLKGKERVELRATGRVTGDITTNRLAIMEGAVFNGMSYMDQMDQLGQEEKKPADTGEKKVLELFFKDKTG